MFCLFFRHKFKPLFLNDMFLLILQIYDFTTKLLPNSTYPTRKWTTISVVLDSLGFSVNDIMGFPP